MAKWVDIVGVDVVLKKFDQLRVKVQEGQIPFLLAGDLKNMIQKRSKEGQGLDGAFDSYSTTPYYRDAKERPVGKGGRRTSKSGRPMQTIFYEGGYKQFAELTKGTGSQVTLHASGAMFRNFQPTLVSKDVAKIMFNSSREMFKAIYVNRQRPFIGARQAERVRLQNRFADLLNNLTNRLGLT